MVHPGQSSKDHHHNKQRGADGKLERHSVDPKTAAYGGAPKRDGGGKANWGKPEDATMVSLDKGDPMYDSGDESLKGKKEDATKEDATKADATKEDATKADATKADAKEAPAATEAKVDGKSD